jgi:NADH-quinone oxidoreductase subunit M
MLSLLIWLPAAAALIGAIAGGRRTPGALALLGSLGALGLAIALIAGWSGHSGQLTHVTDIVWIRSLGIHYKLGLDGLNLFLVALTTFVFSLSLIAANLRDWERRSSSTCCSASPSRPCSAPSSPRISRCSSASST